jgi:hypothetical protein
MYLYATAKSCRLGGAWHSVVKSDAFPSILELGPAPLEFSQGADSKRQTRDRMNISITSHYSLTSPLVDPCRRLRDEENAW